MGGIALTILGTMFAHAGGSRDKPVGFLIGLSMAITGITCAFLGL